MLERQRVNDSAARNTFVENRRRTEEEEEEEGPHLIDPPPERRDVSERCPSRRNNCSRLMPVYRHLSLCIEAERAALPDSAPSSFHLVAPVNDREQVGG